MAAAGETARAGSATNNRGEGGRSQETKDGDLLGAVAAYRRALRADRTNGGAWFGLGRAFARLGRVGDAIRAFQHAVACEPTDAAWRYSLALLLAGRRDWDAATRRFREAIALDPCNWAAHFNLGICCEQLGDLADAEASVAIAATFKPNHWEAQITLGKLRQALGRWADAEAPLSAAVRLKPADWNGHFAQGFSNIRRRLADIGDLSVSILTADEAGVLSVSAERAPKPRDGQATASILIAFKRDNPERVENIATVLTVLERTLPYVAMHVVELGPERHVPAHSRLIYRRLDEAGRRFNRPGLFNLLARDCTTDVLVLYDADTLIPADQMTAAIALARDGGADLAYPFDGRCIDLDRAAIPEILAGAPVRDWSRHWQSIRPFNIGSACVWNRRSFVAAGMENEQLVGWRLDDAERLTRALRLGLRVARVEGPAYHLSHPRGPGPGAKDWADDNGAEIERLSSMSRSALRAHVAAWPWVRQTAL